VGGLPSDIIPRWLRLKAAAQYASIGEARLRELVAQGVIHGASDPGNKRGDLVVDRESIDRYWLDLCGHDAITAAVAKFKGARV
jgi:hypothetical protein